MGVSAVGPGTVPLNSTGPHTSYAASSPVPAVQFAYPSLQPGGRAGNDWSYPNYEPLIQFDWTNGSGTLSDRRGGQGQGQLLAQPRKAPFSMRGKSSGSRRAR